MPTSFCPATGQLVCDISWFAAIRIETRGHRAADVLHPNCLAQVG